MPLTVQDAWPCATALRRDGKFVHRLALFLDDLQWLDTATLDLMEVRKVRQLDDTYSGIRAEERAIPPTSSITASVERLDLATVIKVSQALPGVLEKMPDTLMRPQMRRLWLRIHRWTGLTLGPLLALTALLGTLLVVASPLDRYAHPALFVARSASDAPAAAPAVLPLEQLRRRLVAEFGPDANFTLRPPRQPGETLRVLVRAGWEGTLYMDPSTGAEQGRRGTHEGAYNVLFELHSSLLMEDTGKGVLASVALAYLLLLVTGLVLWWPARWPPSLRIALNRGLLHGLLDLHRTGGAVLGLLIAASVATGGYMAWRPLGGYISAALGQEVVKAPVVPTVPKGEPTGPRLSLDEIVARGQRVFPSQPIGYVQVPAKPNRPVRLRFRLDDDPHPERHQLGLAASADGRGARRAPLARARHRQRHGRRGLSAAHRRTGGAAAPGAGRVHRPLARRPGIQWHLALVAPPRHPQPRTFPRHGALSSATPRRAMALHSQPFHSTP